MSAATERPACVVVGLHQNGLGVVRALGRRGVNVIAVDEHHDGSHNATRYARRVATPNVRGVELIETLEQIGRESRQRNVLTLTMDRSVLLISEHRSRLEPYFTHSLPEDSVVQTLMQKSGIDAFARDNGFHVPSTYRIASEDDLEVCINRIQFPCILKPQIKTLAFVEFSPKKAFFIQSADELRATWHRIVQWEPEVVIQEWIAGPESNLVFCLFYLNGHGQPLAHFVGRKIRQFIPNCGTACSAEPWQDETAYNEGVRFFQAAHYRGFGAIEFKVAPDGRYFLIEPTIGRTEHIFALAEANGVNIPYIGYCDMAGLPVEPPRRRTRSVIYVDWRRDFRAAKSLVEEGQLTWGGWARTVARRTQPALFAWDDPSPAIRHVTQRSRRRTERLARRISRSLSARAEYYLDSMNVGPVSGLGAPVTPRHEVATTVEHLEGAIEWLCAAQDATKSGGVARAYAVSQRSGYPVGWQPAYPETTGYIIPTFFDCAQRLGRAELAERARRMAEWELSVQLPSGGFPGGIIDRPRLPVVFNTGMVLLGLTRAWEETGDAAYHGAIVRAATFLIGTQAGDGGWRRCVNVNGDPQIHAYDCLVNWGLLRASLLFDEPRWRDAAVRNLDFTLTLQHANGWFESNALRPARNATPLTHTIAYAAAGCLEAGALLNEARFIAAAERTARGTLRELTDDGFLPGELNSDWTSAADWACLTGTAQMAIIWRRLHQITGNPEFLDAASRAAEYVKKRQELTGPDHTRGGIAGSFPVGARYGRYQFLNWAAKFFVDLLLSELSDSQHAQPIATTSARRDPQLLSEVSDFS